MIPGVRGPLLSQDFLAHHLAEHCPEATAIDESLVAGFRRWYRRVSATLGPASHVRAILDHAALPLAAWLGFHAPPHTRAVDEGSAWTLLTAGADGPVALYVIPWQSSLSGVARAAARRALAAGARWSLATNGRALHLLDATRGWGRQHLEFDLATGREVPGTLAVLRALCGAPAFQRRRHAAEPLAVLVAASDRHAVHVSIALSAGVRRALEELTGALMQARPRRPAALPHAYEQALTAVYRLLFLLFAEARDLLPTWHPVYRDAYRVGGLGEHLNAGRSPRGTWAALQAIARIAHAGADAGDLRVTAFNGRLFAPSAAPWLDVVRLDDAAVARALAALTRTPGRSTPGRRVSYADLGVEQLGSVYEHLLDYAPVAGGGPSPTLVRHRAATAARKATGTFYTPASLTDFLVRRTLGPLVQTQPPDRILRLRVVDPAMGSGAFLVAACRFLAAAYESALVASGDVRSSDLDEHDRASFRRTVASRCLYGVDLNPMAVQLARLSLWLTTLASDRPLTFLDHHLVAGDSLIGAGPFDLARQRPGGTARGGDPPLLVLMDAARPLASLLPERHRLADEPDDTAEIVRGKERALRRLSHSPALARWRAACDLWCAAWWQDRSVRPAVHQALIDHVLGRFSPLPASAREPALRRAAALAAERRCCHWSLEFPEVFFSSDGQISPDAGFDAVLGNPPWEMLREEAPGTVATAGRQPLLRFVRESGVYPARRRGHVNQYQLFVERAMSLLRPGGRLGLVVPSGLATDDGCAGLRRRLLTACRIDGIVGFENRQAIFPIHRSVRFVLLTATAGAPTRELPCRFGETDPRVLERIHDRRDFPVVLTRTLLDRLSGPDLTIPDLRTPDDLLLTERLFTRHPALGAREGWGASFGRELNATDDRGLFRPSSRARPGDLPVLEGRHLSPFRVDLSAVERVADRRATLDRLGARCHCARTRLAYRDVAAASNRQTLIAALLPADTVSVHTLFCLRTPLATREQDALCALLNSYVANYLVRQRVATHVTTAILERIPVPRPPGSALLFAELADTSRRLRQTPTDGPQLRNGLQAACAEAYGVTREELALVLRTFPLEGDAEKQAVLDAFSARGQPGSCR